MNSIFLEDAGELPALLDGRDPVLLAFTADFCGPSRVLRGVLDAFIHTEEFPMSIVEVDVEKHPAITRQYQVKGTPELILLKNGEPVSSRLGTMTYDELVEYVESEVAEA